MRRLRVGQQFRRMALEPGELDILLAGIHTGAGALIMGRIGLRAREFLGDRRRPGIEPQPGGRHGLAFLVDEPQAVALASDRNGDDAIVEIVDLVRKLAQSLGGILPGARHVLLDAAILERRVAVGNSGHGELFALGRKGDRFDHRCPGVDADNDVARHISSAPWAMAAPSPEEKTWRSPGSMPRNTSVPGLALICSCETETTVRPAISAAIWVWSPSHWQVTTRAFKPWPPICTACGRTPSIREASFFKRWRNSAEKSPAL